jgi:replicative DNA helicase
MNEIIRRWKDQKEGFKQSLDYIQGRKTGKITSIKTPWNKFNDATTDGIEWNTITVIGGRPASGKTLVKDQIVREAFRLNSHEKFRVLEFQLEMLARTSAIREYSSILGKSYKYICSADGSITDEEIAACYEYAKKRVGYPIDIIEEPLTVSEFKEQIVEYMKCHAEKTENGYEYVKTIVTLDHSILLKKASYEKDKMDTLYNLGEVLTELKKKYPIAFIILSQLNRNVDSPERCEDGKYSNYILESDIFGSDALLQHADTLIGINRPGKQKIRFYGPDRYIIDDDTIIVMHFLKCRNGDARMSFFKGEFYRMQLLEIPTPAQQQKKISV